MIDNMERVGSFTSSKIHLLCAKGQGNNMFSAAGETYINSRKQERKLMRSAEVAVRSRDMDWGLCLEGFVESLLDDFGYSLVSQQSAMHPKYYFWAGSADLLQPKIKVGDIKCFKPLNFSHLSDTILEQDVGLFKEQQPKEYWQLVSNAIINNVPKAESIAFMPTIDQLPKIAEYISQMDELEQLKYEWIYNDIIHERYEKLSYLPSNSDYKPLNRFEFTVPQSDIDFLTSRVLAAEKMISKSSVIIAEHDTELNTTIISNFNPSLLKKL